MPAALAFLILIALTNYIMIFFSCHGLHTYGSWLKKYHKVDLWLHHVLVSKRSMQVYLHILVLSLLSSTSAMCLTGAEWYRHIRNMDNHCIIC